MQRAAAIVLVACAAGAWPLYASEVTVLPAPGSGVLTLARTPDAETAVLVGSGVDWFTLRLDGGRPVLVPRPSYRPVVAEPLPADALPMSRAATGSRDIALAWLARPTGRYPHGVLGDRLEAASLRLLARDGRQLEYRLPADAVFEDLIPRLADLDGNGRDSVLVVRSTLTAGAALAAYRLGPSGIEEQAVSEPIGTPMRWLNPVGAGDFDGDGRPDIAVVWHPHVGGVLKIYAFESSRFVEIGQRGGFSNHDIGSTELNLHAIGDFDGDGTADLAIRAADRQGLVLLSFRRRELRTLAAYRHPVAVVGPVMALDLDGNGRTDLVYLLNDRSIAVVLR